jgi:hypothetical protein
MRKLIITEEEKKSILGLHGISEQTTPPANVTPTNTTPTTTTPPSTGTKPMFGTPEQRAAAKAKREGQRKINFDRFVKGAFYKNFYEEIDDEEYNSGCQVTPNPELAYLDGTSMELPEFVYREQQDGSKIKINIKKYQKFVKNQSKMDDVAVDGLMDPNFKATSCGISKAAAKQDKKDWSKK